MRKIADPEPISMTPMIDIVFQLIIFFVLTASNDPTKFDKKLELSDTPNIEETEEFEKLTVHIQILANGTIKIGPGIYSLPVLEAQMKRMVALYGQQVPVIIHADGKTQHLHVSTVMNALAKAGIWRMSLSAYTEQKG